MRIFAVAFLMASLLIVSGKAHAAIAFVQAAKTASQASATGISIAMTSNVTIGNTLIVGYTPNGNLPGSCTDSLGNVFHHAIFYFDVSTSEGLGVCFATITAGGADTVTVTFASSTGYRGIIASEYSGISATHPLDQSASNNAVGSTAADNITTGSVTTTADGELIFAVAVQDNSGASNVYSAGTGYTLRANTKYGGDYNLTTEDKILATAGATSATFTQSASQRYIAQVATFRADGTGEGIATGGITYLQGMTYTNISAVASISTQLSNNVTVGNTIIVAYTPNGNLIGTCTDSLGNTYQSAAFSWDSSLNEGIGICYATVTVGGLATVTVTFASSTTYRGIAVAEYRGISSSSPLDKASTNIAGGTTAADNITSGSVTTTSNGQLIFGAAVQNQSTTSNIYSAGTGFTLRKNAKYNGDYNLTIEDKIQPTAGATAATFTQSVALRYVAAAATFRPALVRRRISNQ